MTKRYYAGDHVTPETLAEAITLADRNHGFNLEQLRHIFADFRYPRRWSWKRVLRYWRREQ